MGHIFTILSDYMKPEMPNFSQYRNKRIKLKELNSGKREFGDCILWYEDFPKSLNYGKLL